MDINKHFKMLNISYIVIILFYCVTKIKNKKPKFLYFNYELLCMEATLYKD